MIYLLKDQNGEMKWDVKPIKIPLNKTSYQARTATVSEDTLFVMLEDTTERKSVNNGGRLHVLQIDIPK